MTEQSLNFPLLGLFLFTACLVAMITRRIGMPYSVGLVIAGFGVAFLPLANGVHITPDIIMEIFLPPLIFEAALLIRWKAFRREMPLILTLASVGVIMAAVLVAAGMHKFAGWSWLGAAFFGVLIAATDPVSVIATFKEVPVDHRLHLLVEGESLLNDGVAAVGFAVLLAVAAGASPSAGGVALSVIKISLGGVVCGLLVAGALLLIAGRTRDKLVEVTLTMLAAYGSFLLAEHFHMSGVLATLAAGILIGNRGNMGSISDEGREAVVNFWDFAAFLANSFVFLLIGIGEASPTLIAAIPVAIIATLLSLFGRAVAVYPLSLAFAKSALAVPRRYQHILFWGGLRGALALALALAIPTSVAERGEIIAAAFLVVAFSIFVQGLTMPGLLRRLRLIRAAEPAECADHHAADGA
nr:sodium:proton antiporter [uncultured Sphingomonas sp.]